MSQHQHTARLHPSPDPWEDVEPCLNDALACLKSGDREAVLLRFFEGYSLAEVGVQLGVSENTARMRVTRALDRMRRHLAHQGVAIGAALLVGLLTEKARAAPVALSSEGLSLGGGSTQVNHLMQGVLKTMRIKTTMTVAATVAAATIIAIPLIAASSKIIRRPSSVAVTAAQGLGTAQRLAGKITARFTLGTGEHAYYRVDLPQGASLVVLDIRRSDGKWNPQGTTTSATLDVRSSLSYLDGNGRPFQAGAGLDRQGQPVPIDTFSVAFQEIENRTVARLYLWKPTPVILDIHNQGVGCHYWLTALPSAPMASRALAVPLFGERVPKPMTLGAAETGRLEKNGYAYFAIPLQAGSYKASLDFNPVSGKTTGPNGDLSLNGEMALAGVNGLLGEGVDRMDIAQLHLDLGATPPYNDVSKFTLKTGGVFLISVSNQGSDPTDAGDDAVNFKAKITLNEADSP